MELATTGEVEEEISVVIQDQDTMQACPSAMLSLQGDIFQPFCRRRVVDALTKEDEDMSTICRRSSTNEHRFAKESFMQEFDLDHENPGVNPADEEAEAMEIERKLDEVLTGEHYDLIKDHVTPRILSRCKTNALLKAFEVKKKLRDLPDSGGAERNEFEMLANSVDEFTVALIHPLKSDDHARRTFRLCLDTVIKKAIDTGQKKFISHPVIYKLLEAKWYGSFNSMRKGSWTSSSFWKYFFLNIWAVFDCFLSPFILVLFFIIRWLQVRTRKMTETEICFAVSLSSRASDETFALVKKSINYIVHQYSCHSTNYCIMLRQDDNAPITSISFEEEDSREADIFDKVKELRKSNSVQPWLHNDLCAVRDAFKSSHVRMESRKVLVVFVNDLRSVDGVREVIKDIEEMSVEIVAVGFGEQAKLSQLEEITEKNALHFEEFESPRSLGIAIVQGLEGKDVYELYLDYFTTPYFIFCRDKLSSIALLGLLFAICLRPSTIAFSRIEWAILLFFLGRIVMEADQLICAIKAERKSMRKRHRSLQKGTYEECSYPDQKADPSTKKLVLRKLANYYSDCWHVCDLVILVIYFIAFTLHLVTWATSDSVPGNRSLAIAGYLYGLIAMFLTLRAFGHLMEVDRGMGAIEIAVFVILKDLRTIFWLFIAMILGFSLAMTKIFVSEKAYVSLGSSHENPDKGFSCWLDITRHLTWSLLGISGLEAPFSSINDAPSAILAELLYMVFMVLGVILLVNVMIALLSNTYQQVQNNALKEWSFKKAVTIKTFSACHPVPVPFNLISMPLIAVCRMFQRCLCKRKSFEMPGILEEARDAALDKLVEKLQMMYFETYGYSFPLTDEGKIDQVLHETDGNRMMSNQVIQRVFKQQNIGQDTFTNDTCAWESLGIGIEGSLLTYEGSSSCDDCELRNNSWTHHGARCLTQFTPEMPRFEVLIQESGERRIVGVGVVFEGYNCHFMPGWTDGTVGYHADDGKIFGPGCSKQGKDVPDAMAYRGDLMACEVDFDGAEDDTIVVTFFKNSIKVESASVKFIPGQTKLFPFIGMGYVGIRVLAKMCPRHNCQPCLAGDVENITRDQDVQEKLDILKEEIIAMEKNRKKEAKELEEKLLNEIRKLTRVIREKKI